MPDTIPYYVINEPYELFYKNSSTFYPVGAHTHNKAEIYLTLSDLPDALLNNTVSSIPAGTLIIIPPFCVHQLYHQMNVCYERYILNLDPQWLETVICGKQALTEFLCASAPLVITLSKEQLSTLTKAMNKVLPLITERSISSTANLLTLLSILEYTIKDINTAESNSKKLITKSQKTVNDIIAYINNHIDETIALSDLEEHFYLNKDYMSRLFVKHTHTSIGRYISIQRIAKAQEYLREGLSVQQVSDKLGFSSYAYFFKVFQKMTGISPSQYRTNSYKNDSLY